MDEHVLWESSTVYTNDTSVWPNLPLLREYREVARGTLIEMMDAYNSHAGDDPDYEYHIRRAGEHPATVPTIYLTGDAE